MGKNINKVEYHANDFEHFQNVLYKQLDELKHVLDSPEFGRSPLKVGAELEMYLVDKHANISLSNQLLINDLNDPQFQPELNQYNLELNLSAVNQAGRPFTALLNEMLTKTSRLEKIAEKRGINIIPVGILPTLKANEIDQKYMTDIARYHCLSNELYKSRGEDFNIHIDGDEPVKIKCSDICAEGANTSFQVHMMTEFSSFTDTFNACQLTLPLVTAIGANSPIFIGNSVWDETRIALFKQSLDIRHRDQFQWQQPTRVNFGLGWLRQSVYELFAEAVALHKPILPATFETKSTTKLPDLYELNLHMGTLWPWHRPVYDNHDNGHMRIEFRAIPAGPTSLDMLANAAFAIGLAQGMTEQVNDYLNVLPFRFAEYNFYRAAQHGLDANILWPLKNKYKPEETPIADVILSLLPMAKKGLQKIGIEDSEICQYLEIIKTRVNKKMTGAIWQKQTLKYLKHTKNKEEACQQLVLKYLKNCQTGIPVALWERPWL